MPVTFDLPLSDTICGAPPDGPGGGGLGLGSFGFGGFSSFGLGGFSGSDFSDFSESSGIVIFTSSVFLVSASNVAADRICSGLLDVGEIGFCRFLSSSFVMYRFLDGDSGSSICTTCSFFSSLGDSVFLVSEAVAAGFSGDFAGGFSAGLSSDLSKIVLV